MPERVTGPAFYFPSIEEKYGKPIGHWLDLINSSELTRHKALVDWLKADYGVGHGHANALTLRLLGGLTTEEIAHGLLTAEPAIAKRITRAKRTLASNDVPFEMPAAADRQARVGRHAEAAAEFRRAATLTRNDPERTALLRRAGECDARVTRG